MLPLHGSFNRIRQLASMFNSYLITVFTILLCTYVTMYVLHYMSFYLAARLQDKYNLVK